MLAAYWPFLTWDGLTCSLLCRDAVWILGIALAVGAYVGAKFGGGVEGD